MNTDNRGSVALVYAVPISSLVRIRVNFGERDTFTPEFCNREDIVRFPPEPGCSYSFSEVERLTEDGKTYDVEVNGTIPKTLFDESILEKLTNMPLYALVFDMNGEGKMFGEKDIPLVFEYERETGETAADLNAYRFTLKAVEAQRSIPCVGLRFNEL